MVVGVILDASRMTTSFRYPRICVAVASVRWMRSMKVVAPVGWDASVGAGRGLILRTVPRRCQIRPVEHPVGGEVVEPDLSRLEALDHRMAGSFGVMACVLVRRGIAAADMTALRTATQMDPPVTREVALYAAGAAGGS